MRVVAAIRTHLIKTPKNPCKNAKTFVNTQTFCNTMQLVTVAVSRPVTLVDRPVIMARKLLSMNSILV